MFMKYDYIHISFRFVFNENTHNTHICILVQLWKTKFHTSQPRRHRRSIYLLARFNLVLTWCGRALTSFYSQCYDQHKHRRHESPCISVKIFACHVALRFCALVCLRTLVMGLIEQQPYDEHISRYIDDNLVERHQVVLMRAVLISGKLCDIFRASRVCNNKMFRDETHPHISTLLSIYLNMTSNYIVLSIFCYTHINISIAFTMYALHGYYLQYNYTRPTENDAWQPYVTCLHDQRNGYTITHTNVCTGCCFRDFTAMCQRYGSIACVPE